jgi:uncharacterized protein
LEELSYMESGSQHRWTNRLIHETSPYLLQHAHNPVEWYPWGEEALKRARQEDKPILLSIGYSACHWCHVMERESFENETIARVMNERFVNIKVDREERPDLDELYMNAVQVMTGSGGWPMTLFLTPDLVPFHGGTYFPPEDRHGLPGFPKILAIVSDYYKNHRGEVGKLEAQVRQTLHQMFDIMPSQEKVDFTALSKALEELKGQFDPTYGGFGKAPKFPSSMALSFLLRYWKKTGEKEALEIVEKSLDRMAKGGIYDHLGGGFHRYSVDERWLIPHFEKMLYDNALLARTYAEAYQATENGDYRRVVEETLNYVLREMKDPAGGFYSTRDADSEGEEGKFYVWTRDEVREAIGEELSTPFCAYYGIAPQGNFEGKASVLNVVYSLEKVSELYRISVTDLERVLKEGRQKLFAERQKRTSPGRDEKILTAWNGLMISALTDGFKITGDVTFLNGAMEAAHFILKKMRKNGHLMRVYKEGRCHTKGYAEDYAFFTQALIDLYESTLDVSWLAEADQLDKRMVEQFWDEKNGGFFYAGRENERLIAQSKNPYDNAIPSPNSIAVMNLVRLGYLTGDECLKEKALRTLQLFSGFFTAHPSGFTQMLSGLMFFLDPEEIGILGEKGDLRTDSMIREIHRAYLPNKIIHFRGGQERIERGWFPFLHDKRGTATPTVYICKGSTCLPPARNEEELRKIL